MVGLKARNTLRACIYFYSLIFKSILSNSAFTFFRYVSAHFYKLSLTVPSIVPLYNWHYWAILKSISFTFDSKSDIQCNEKIEKGVVCRMLGWYLLGADANTNTSGWFLNDLFTFKKPCLFSSASHTKTEYMYKLWTIR